MSHSTQDPFVQQVHAALTRHRMVEPGQRVLVAVSGGPDSLALLHALWCLQGPLQLTLHAAHVHHGLRGRGADRDAAFVAETARALGLECSVERVTLTRTRGVALQEAAREARYGVLRRLARELGAHRLALGHQADDQAETVIMRFLRGSGLRGLGGIRPVRGPIIRPLLAIPRREIEAYLARAGLRPRRDPSNRDPAFLRNRIRHQLLPLLERSYNPGLREALRRMAEVLQEDEAFLELETGRAYARFVEEQPPAGNPERVLLPVDVLVQLPRGLQRRLVRRALARAAGSWEQAGFAHVERVLALAAGKTPGPLSLPGGGQAGLADGRLVLEGRKAAQPPPPPREVELVVPGETLLPELGIRVRARLLEGEAAVRVAAAPHGEEPFRALFPWDALSPPLAVRTRREGDRLRPLGLGGTKKLKDLFIDLKVPQAEREYLPLVVDRKGILWVVGLRLDERAALVPGTDRVLSLEVSPAPGGRGGPEAL